MSGRHEGGRVDTDLMAGVSQASPPSLNGKTERKQRKIYLLIFIIYDYKEEIHTIFSYIIFFQF